jgi:predicted metalloprotease
VLALVAGACATSLEINVVSSGDAVTDPGTLLDQATPEATVGPTPMAGTATADPTAEAPTPTPAPFVDYDQAIDAYFEDVERFWTDAAPRELGFDFESVGERVPYDPRGNIPACAGEIGPRELYVGNAFYCQPDDYIAWDDVELFPDLYTTFGDFAVGLVIAHEYSHAIQARAGLDGPTILIELQADCLAGAWAGSVAAGSGVGIPFELEDLDNAIGGFLTFADPLGTPAADPAAHGTAFDRLNAFAEGYELGLPVCETYLASPPPTASILIDRRDANEGDLPLDELLPLLVEDLEIFFTRLGTDRSGPGFVAPGRLEQFGGPLGRPPDCGGAPVDPGSFEGSAYLCEADTVVYADRRALEQLFSEVGDFAPSYSIAHAFATSVSTALATDTTQAVLGADCLVGVWARDVFDEAAAAPPEPTHVLVLSAGDLDEGIVGLLLAPPTGPSLRDPGAVTTFDRVAEFGSGFFRGAGECSFG